MSDRALERAERAELERLQFIARLVSEQVTDWEDEAANAVPEDAARRAHVNALTDCAEAIHSIFVAAGPPEISADPIAQMKEALREGMKEPVRDEAVMAWRVGAVSGALMRAIEMLERHEHR